MAEWIFSFGGRAVPFKYGEIPRSYILINDGGGRFSERTEEIAPQLANGGMVKDAVMADVDKDGIMDLVVAYEWGGIYAYLQSNKTYQRKLLCSSKGWWNCIKPVDIDNDGDVDFILGNLGENSRIKLHCKNQSDYIMVILMITERRSK